jgi:hypothetical protein
MIKRDYLLVIVVSSIFVVFFISIIRGYYAEAKSIYSSIYPNVASRTLNLNNYGFYYGQSKGKIYLGNTISPLTIIEFDSTLQHKKQYSIQLTPDTYLLKPLKQNCGSIFFFMIVLFYHLSV